VHEIALGTTLAEALARCGGTRGHVSGILLGGYFGRWVAVADAQRTLMTPDVLGAGAIVALPEDTCAAAECARVVRYLAEQSAGQCGPCVHGLASLADRLDIARRGDGRDELRRLTRLVDRRGACRHPDGAVRFVESALDVFAAEFARHARHRGCGRPLQRVLPVPEVAP
jgi:NADH:ubiquinone oxidoreductase subunit F (NADH-binding)